jgi:hypothetical protein
MFEGKLGSLGGVLAAAVLGASLPVHAEPLLHNFNPYGESRSAANPPVARYVTSVGRRAFIFDRVAVAPEALFKFDDAAEVWVLEPSPAPGGGRIYRNDAGERVLTVTSLGGLTLYTGTPDGVPVSIQGDAEELALPPLLPIALMLQRTPQASERCSRVAEHYVNVTAINYTPATTPLFLDAMTIATDAVVSLAKRKDAKPFLSKLDQVLIVTGAKPDVGFNGSVLTIVVTPGRGYAGRPSSSRIVKAALKR